jgi:hypothetical protein
MTEHPAVAYLRNGLARAEALAQAATPGPWFAHTHDWNDHEFAADIGTSPTPGPDQAANVVGHGWESGGVVEQHDADFIAANSPDAVLRRVQAERAVLALHEPVESEYADGDGVERSSVDCAACDNGGSSWTYPCRTVLLLAEAWGWEA